MNLKKLFVILLLLIYGVNSVGATVHLHYCMNEYVGWELSHSKEDDKCGKCGMKDQKSGCCKDEHKQIKISGDQNEQQHKDFFTPLSFTPAILSVEAVDVSVYVGAIIESTISIQPSPPRQGPPLFIAYCSFLI